MHIVRLSIVEESAIHWAADLLLFPGLASCLREPFGPQENVKDLHNAVPSILDVLIGYSDAGDYVLSFTITTTVD